MTSNAGITKDNFVYISLYISFVKFLSGGALLPGFVFTNLKSQSDRKLAYWFSAGSFSLYHVAMMNDWFSPVLFLLVIVRRLFGGMIFNLLNEKLDTIQCSWLTHIFANFAINTVGFILLW